MALQPFQAMPQGSIVPLPSCDRTMSNFSPAALCTRRAQSRIIGSWDSRTSFFLSILWELLTRKCEVTAVVIVVGWCSCVYLSLHVCLCVYTSICVLFFLHYTGCVWTVLAMQTSFLDWVFPRFAASVFNLQRWELILFMWHATF